MLTTAFTHCPRDAPAPVDGVPRPYAQLPSYCRPCNLTGHPAVTIPACFDRAPSPGSGQAPSTNAGQVLPIGIQIAGLL
jgi:Asp-tRNA(Asn)/Glu-tRNA(Gln) amidotransferase A subunit family amidase